MDSYKEILKKTYKFGLPIAIQAFILASVRLIDNLFVGHLDNAMHVSSGINAISNVSFICATLIAGFISGVGVYFSQASSLKDAEKQKVYFRIKLFLCVSLSMIFLTLTSIFLRDFSSLWIASGEGSELASDYAIDYGKYVIPTLALDMIVVVFASSFIEKKKTKLTMAIAIIAIIVNSSLNYPLMYTCKMGVEGSAIATMVARFVELIIWFVYILIKKPEFIGKIRYWFKVDFKVLKKILPRSAFWSINSLLTSLAFTLQILMLSRESISAGASMIIAGTIAQMVGAFVGGYTQAAGILISYEIVKKENKDFKNYVNKIAHLSFVIGLFSGLLLIALMPLIGHIYPKYNHATIYDSKIMVASIAASISFNMLFSVYSSTLKSAGYSKLLIIIDSLISWTFRVGLTLLLTQTNNGIELGYVYMIISSVSIFQFGASLLVFKIKGNNLKALVTA